MVVESKVQVLKQFRPFTRILCVYNWENFNNSNKLIVLRNIFQVIGFTILFISLSLIMVSGYWFCVDKQFDMTDISLAVPIIFCAFQMVVTYVSLMSKNRGIIRALDNLQCVIGEREYFLFLPYRTAFLQASTNYVSSHFLSKGCINSAKSMENYMELEKVHTKITSIIFKTTMMINNFLCLLDALLPISYLIFNQPDPDHWMTVLGFQ